MRCALAAVRRRAFANTFTASSTLRGSMTLHYCALLERRAAPRHPPAAHNAPTQDPCKVLVHSHPSGLTVSGLACYCVATSGATLGMRETACYSGEYAGRERRRVTGTIDPRCIPGEDAAGRRDKLRRAAPCGGNSHGITQMRNTEATTGEGTLRRRGRLIFNRCNLDGGEACNAARRC